MLRQRVITALVLLPLVLGPILFLPTLAVYAVLGVFVLAGAFEWTALIGLRAPAARAAYVGLVALALALAWLADQHRCGDWVLGAGVLWWLYAITLVAGYPANMPRPWGAWRGGLAGLLMLVPALLAVARLHAASGHWGLRIFYLFALIWAADIGAYFAGRRFGRRKLAPGVSPGKTLEGAIGGFVLAMLAVSVAPWVFGSGRFDWLPMVVLSAGVVVISVIGDLTESLFKRARGVKDSGILLPGHGGVLDRIDSLLAAAPVLALGLSLLGI